MMEDYKDKEKVKIIDEKRCLETTLKSLSSEVEELSQKNEEFLAALRKKDFYIDFSNANRELNSLRDTHMLLINLIENNELNISNENANTKFYKDNQKFYTPSKSHISRDSMAEMGGRMI
jgi:nucleoside-triphosphatase THEP1